VRFTNPGTGKEKTRYSNFLQREFYPALKTAELPRVVFHSLRHTTSTMLASSTIPPGAVHRILGHASFATTMKLYGGLTAAALESAAGTLAGLLLSRHRTKTGQMIHQVSRYDG
jgi:integrase